MELQLINVGRNKVNRTVTVKNEKAMWKEIGSCLMSKDLELTETEIENKYTVWAGTRPVGEVILKQ